MTMLQMETTMVRPNKSARAKKEAPPTARPKTYERRIASLSVPGAVDMVKRVGDTLENMLRRRQLDDRSFRAGERLRNAYEVVYGQVGGSMDFDRVRGAGRPGSGPPVHYLEAAGVLNDAWRNLYSLDYKVVILIACEGHTIERAAQMIYGAKPSRADKEEIGRRLREGLRQLSGGKNKGEAPPNPAAWHAANATAYVPSTSGIIERGGVVHATGHKIFRNK